MMACVSGSLSVEWQHMCAQSKGPMGKDQYAAGTATVKLVECQHMCAQSRGPMGKYQYAAGTAAVQLVHSSQVRWQV